MEECATTFDGQVVLGPIPQFSQVLVVQCIKGVNTRRKEKEEGQKKNQKMMVNGARRERKKDEGKRKEKRRKGKRRGEDSLCLKMFPSDDA